MKTDIDIEIHKPIMIKKLLLFLFSQRLTLTQEEIRYLKAFVAQRQQGKANGSATELQDENA